MRTRADDAPTLPGLDPPRDAPRASPRPRPPRPPSAAPDDTSTVLWDEEDFAPRRPARGPRIRETDTSTLEEYGPMLEEIGVLPLGEVPALRRGTEVMLAGRRSAGPARAILLEDSTGRATVTLPAAAPASPLLLIAATTTGDGDAPLRATGAWDLRQLWRDWGRIRRAG